MNKTITIFVVFFIALFVGSVFADELGFYGFRANQYISIERENNSGALDRYSKQKPLVGIVKSKRDSKTKKEIKFGPVYATHIIKVPGPAYSGQKNSKKPQQLSYRGQVRNVWVEKVVQLDIAPIILKYSEKYKVDPHLVKAVIWAESNFKTYVVSPYGALGLMQIMPHTARAMKIKSYLDPEENIAAGTRYLKGLLERFKTEKLALAAYNAGAGNVIRYGGIPPFYETRCFVSKVMNYYQKSKQLSK